MPATTNFQPQQDQQQDHQQQDHQHQDHQHHIQLDFGNLIYSVRIAIGMIYAAVICYYISWQTLILLWFIFPHIEQMVNRYNQLSNVTFISFMKTSQQLLPILAIRDLCKLIDPSKIF